MIDTNIITVEERYINAGHSSNLKCETRVDAPVGAVGVVIAAGWSRSRIGAALMRLHTKPDRLGIEQMHQQISLQAERWGIECPEAVAASILSWWLRHVCSSCKGVRFELIPGTPSLSSRICRPCHGTGEAKLAYGETGKRIAVWLDDCKDANVDSIKARLRNMQK